MGYWYDSSSLVRTLKAKVHAVVLFWSRLLELPSEIGVVFLTTSSRLKCTLLVNINRTTFHIEVCCMFL